MKRLYMLPLGVVTLSLLSSGIVAEAATSSHTSTFAVDSRLQMPSRVQNKIRSECKITVSLPVTFKLGQTLPKNSQLAIDLDVSSSGYKMDIFERPKGSHTRQYAMDTLVGDMGSDLRSPNLSMISLKKGFTSHSPVKLAGGVTAMDYSKTKDHLKEDRIIWIRSGWIYESDAMGIYSSNTVAMENSIAKFLVNHKVPVRKATHGYVQALWSGNRPDFTVAWTYNNKQWYSLNMSTLSGTLQTANTVATL